MRIEICRAEDLAARPGCPELNGLLVRPESLRSRGIGTALVRAAEERAVARGTGLMGLGVGDDNPAAARLYARLGYRPTVSYLDRWAYLDLDGVRQECADPCVFLVKDLSSSGPLDVKPA